MRKAFVVAALVVALGTGAAWGGLFSQRTPVDFFPGHTHKANGTTHGAPYHSSETLLIDAHSGGTDKNGCHNASVPYHCH